MIRFSIVLCVLIGVQGKAFPNRNKRNYEASYHYIPVAESTMQLQASYPLENYPNYHGYVHEYVPVNEHDWSAYYQPMVSHPIRDSNTNMNEHHKAYYNQPRVPPSIRDPSSDINVYHKAYSLAMVPHLTQNPNPNPNVNEHHKMKPKHNWHFIDQSHAPITHHFSESHFESDVDAPNVIEALVKKDVIDKHDTEYDIPVVVETLVKKSQEDAKVPEIGNSPNKAVPIGYNYDRNSIIVDSSIKLQDNIEYKKKLSNMDLLSKNWNPSVSYDAYYPVNKKIEPYDEFELPVVDSSIFRKEPVDVESSYRISLPVKEKPVLPVKEKPVLPVKEKPVLPLDYSVKIGSFNDVKKPEYESPVIIEALVRKENLALHKDEDFETPLIAESLIRKFPLVHESKKSSEKDKILPENMFYSEKGSKLALEDVEDSDTPAVEALTFEKDANNEILEDESVAFHESHGFSESNINLEDEDHGSAMDLDRSRFARSFLPVNSNIFSTFTNIKEQEKLKFKSCVTPKHETGNCMPFQLCSVLSAMSNIDELLRNVCLIDEVFIGVCCPEFPVETVQVNWEQLKPDNSMVTEDNQLLKDCGKLPSMVTNSDPWPWMALLIAKSSDKVFCGGALINEQYVLTAAHCTIRIPRNQILVRLGSPLSVTHAEADFEVIEIKRHAGYNPRTMQNDIALLKLSRRVHLGDFRRVVCLAKDAGDLVNESANLLRWKETPGAIEDVESLLVISSKECQRRMRTAISDSILCSEPRTDETMCNADSGAPLIIAKDDKFEVIGILTWNRNDCDERFPTVFTRVSSYHRWIEKLAS